MNERNRSVNNFRPSISENNGALEHVLFIILQSAASLGKNASDTMVTVSNNYPQWSINGASMIFDLASWIL